MAICSLLQAALEILVAKCFEMLHAAFCVVIYIREIYPIEGVVFAHGVYRHIAEDQSVARFKGLVEGIVADNVPRQTGGGA